MAFLTILFAISLIILSKHGECLRFTSFLNESFENDLNKAIWSYENFSYTNIQLVSSPVLDGNKSIVFRVYPDEIVNMGNRAEIVLKNSDPICSEAWYRWSFYLPTTYNDSDPSKWQIFGQWHDQPSFWESIFGHPARSPMVSYLYYFINDTCFLKLSYGVGSNRTMVGSIPFSKGTWNTITTHVFWSVDSNGFIESWLNQSRFTPFNGHDYKYIGPNMFNNEPAYLKIGIYRDKTIDQPNTIYYDRFIRSPSSFE